MNYSIKKEDIDLVLEALDSYLMDIEHGTNNGYKYPYTKTEVKRLIKHLEGDK
jgi:hypothetical protein